MLWNYIKIAFRNILRHRAYSIINILGLSISITVCLLIFIFIQSELSFDKHFDDGDRIFRITGDLSVGDNLDHIAMVSSLVGPALQEDFPEIEKMSRIVPIGTREMLINNESYFEEFHFVDSDFFDIFSYEILAGNKSKFFDDPYNIILSEQSAKKLFKDQNPLNKTIDISSEIYTVVGIFKKPFKNTHLEIDIIVPYENYHVKSKGSLDWDWFRLTCYTYIMFNDKANAIDFQTKLDYFYEKTIEPWIKKHELKAYARYYHQNIKDIHLYSTAKYDSPTNSSPANLRIFGLVAIFILLIASINYTNMATAIARKRSKEIGVRKVVGAFRFHLIRQYIGESVITAIISLIIALVVTEIISVPFMNFAEIHPNNEAINNFHLSAYLLGIIIFVGIFGGSYPAFFMSAFEPIKVLKNINEKGMKSIFIRQFLVILQFTISIIMIISTLILINQMQFMKNKELGFDKSHILAVEPQISTSFNYEKLDVLKEELKKNTNIENVTLCNTFLGNKTGKLVFHMKKGKQYFKERSISLWLIKIF